LLSGCIANHIERAGKRALMQVNSVPRLAGFRGKKTQPEHEAERRSPRHRHWSTPAESREMTELGKWRYIAFRIIGGGRLENSRVKRFSEAGPVTFSRRRYFIIPQLLDQALVALFLVLCPYQVRAGC